MAWLEKIIKFIQENWDLLLNNPFPFIFLAIICIGLSLGLNKLINSDKDKQIKRLKDDNNDLKKQLADLKSQNDDLKKKFQEADIVKLISGLDDNTQSLHAEKVSEHIAEKYKKNK